MRRLLVIQTTPASRQNPLISRLIERESAHAGHEVQVADLTQPAPDYKQLLHQIFEADSVQIY